MATLSGWFVFSSLSIIYFLFSPVCMLYVFLKPSTLCTICLLPPNTKHRQTLWPVYRDTKTFSLCQPWKLFIKAMKTATRAIYRQSHSVPTEFEHGNTQSVAQITRALESWNFKAQICSGGKNISRVTTVWDQEVSIMSKYVWANLY